MNVGSGSARPSASWNIVAKGTRSRLSGGELRSPPRITGRPAAIGSSQRWTVASWSARLGPLGAVCVVTTRMGRPATRSRAPSATRGSCRPGCGLGSRRTTLPYRVPRATIATPKPRPCRRSSLSHWPPVVARANTAE